MQIDNVRSVSEQEAAVMLTLRHALEDVLERFAAESSRGTPDVRDVLDTVRTSGGHALRSSFHPSDR